VIFRPAELKPDDIRRMDREELIGALLQFNDYRSFQFTPVWLNRQWVRRLRKLLLAVHDEYQALHTRTQGEADAR
jgi:hypothetical protein